MALAAFDDNFSFSQESVARLGDRAGSGQKLTEEQQRQLKQSKAFQAQLQVDQLLEEYCAERDKKRAALDQSFTPEEADFSASKAFDYDRAVNYYEVLGIEEYAPLDEVNRSYKRLSLVYHPDKTKGMSVQQQQDYEIIFISVKNAHLVLGDQATRRQYDKDRDQDRAKELVSGVKAQKSEHVDLTEVLKRISEMQRPPGKTVEVPLELELEQFFYGAHKVIHRTRRFKDFYAGLVTQEHPYRLHVVRGASEPVEIIFKEQGDHNPDARPDTVSFRVTSKAHALLERRGADLQRREEVQLPSGSMTQALFECQVSGLQGRQLLLWGHNPFYPSWRNHPAMEPRLEVAVLSEGLSDHGSFRFSLRFRPATEVFSKEEARQFLKDLLNEAKGSPSDLERLERVAAAKVPEGAHRLRRAVSAAISAVPNEWGLIAKAVRLLRPQGASPEEFISRHSLGSLKSTTAEEWDEAACERQSSQGEAHGRGGLCKAKLSARAAKRWRSDCSLQLRPFGEEIQLFTEPKCSLKFFSNLENSEGFPVFGVCLASPGATASAWQQLLSQLGPLLQQSIFRLMPSARIHVPRCLGDFAAPLSERTTSLEPVPWKRLGTEAFRQGDFWLAAHYYSRWMEDIAEDSEKAVAFSNRAACLAKVGDFDGASADAQTAKELAPSWARPWARIGFAALQRQALAESLEAYRRAVALEPCLANLEGLLQAARAAEMADDEEEKRKGDAAFSMKPAQLGTAVACYTVALAHAAAKLPVKEVEALATSERRLLEAENRISAEESFRQAAQDLQKASQSTAALAALYGNRSAALCHMKFWSEAVQDARIAAKLQQSSAKARCRLGVALLGAGKVEEAYAEFAWALAMDSHYSVARQGLEACLTAIPKWRSRAQKSQLLRDRGRPRAFTKVWVVSDLYYDHKANAEWCQAIDDAEFQDDVLIVAGNVAETMHTTLRALKVLKAKYRRVFFVPGNRDLALNASEVRTARFPDSVAKLLALIQACDDMGVEMFPAAISQDVYVVPLFSWYNAEFDKRSRPDPNMIFDPQCVWPLDQHQLWKWMLKLNEAHLRLPYRGSVLTFSHFLPLTTLPFDGTGKQAQAMGCEEIEDQLRQLRSVGHAYGHSTMRAHQVAGGTVFVNHALGVLEDEVPSPHLFFDANGVVKSGR